MDKNGCFAYWDGYILRDGESLMTAVYHRRSKWWVQCLMDAYDIMIEDGYIADHIEYEVNLCEPNGVVITTITNEGDWALARLTYE
jgi:hypothetical protein